MSQTEVIILREFLAADTGLVSGARLAKLLGVSRVAVWMQLQKFTRQGFTFEAVQSRGYRLRQTPDELHLALVQAHLSGRPRGPALSRSKGSPPIICLDTVDSTNSEAERQLAADGPVPLVILARAQTRGRGRRGQIGRAHV